MTKTNCAPVLSPAITVLDSPNIAVVSNQTSVSITGSTGFFNQQDLNYLLAANISVTGTLIEDDNSIGFVCGWIVPPSSSLFTQSLNYPAQEQKDFTFYVNGVRVDDSQVLTFEPDVTNMQSTASFDLGYPLRAYDVVTAVGRFKIS